MRKIRRVLACVITMCMLFSVNVGAVHASELVNDEETITSGQEAEQVESTEQAEETESIESTEQDRETEVIETPVVVEEITSQNENVEDGIEQYLLNYVVIEKDCLTASEIQRVVIDIANQGQTIENANLTYINTTTNMEYSVAVSTIYDTTLVFEIDFSSNMPQGEYALERIDYIIQGSNQQVVFEDAGVDARFGVDVQLDLTPDAWIYGESEEADTAGIVIKDVSEDLTETDIESALADNANTYSDDISNTLLGSTSNGKIVVVLDPGHGGSDSGACRTINGVTYMERDINLKIASACKAELEKYKGIEVYMTRSDNNTSLGLTERAEYAKSVNADYLISIHINSTGSETTSTSGAEVIIPNSSYNAEIHNQASELGEKILERLEELGIVNRGTYTRNTTINERYPDGSLADYYTVIYASKMRGIAGMIVEHAFINNPADVEKYLSTDSAMASVGQADAHAIAEYLNLSLEAETVYNGIDYSAVYDYEYYIGKYSDLNQIYGTTENTRGALEHFVLCGMNEGRQAKETFDVNSYRLEYQDLRATFRTDLRQYYLHYIYNGKSEGRVATGTKTLQNPITIYQGVDYGAVYDYDYYMKQYSDLQKVFGDKCDDVGALEHFVLCGMNEGRQAKETFDVYSYRLEYQDLRLAFRNDLKQYYIHYIYSGKSEGRVATGTKALQNPITIYQGVNYSSVYDYNYYINLYGDLQNVYGNKYDDYGALEHFVLCGIYEGRQAKEGFNVHYYRNNYIDLVNAFGNNNMAYVYHYITCGKNEGRIADQQILYTIMGSSNVTVSQMVAYYNANAAYPSYYGATDAPTIEQFCQIYLEECNAEGVKAEVAFSQAMKETGFLRYGGDVSINQHNFAGLGATGNGAAGASFSSVREGVRAQVQHLKAYASTEPLNNPCVDGRFQYVTRGTAPYVEWLGINENPYGKGWATATGYGYSMRDGYIYKLCAY